MDYEVNESTVEQNAPQTAADAAEQAADVPVGGEEQEVSASSFYEQPEGEQVEKTAVDEQAPIKTQKDFQRALDSRLSGAKQQGYERGKQDAYNSPEMQFVRALIEDRAREKGITAAQALQELQNERIRAKSEDYAKNPARFYEDMMLGRNQFQAQQTRQSGYMPVEEMARQMAAAVSANEIPEGFDINNPGEQFFADANRYGSVSAALRIFKAEHAGELQAKANANQIATELQRRQKAAKPMTPTSANPAAPTSPNYATMSSEQFKKLESQIKKAAMEGKRVRLN